ncbi:hypothetical protein SDC9_77194 [bioreactor metagenome]|uniref:Uncharacterized protein n=1 Tax=bioreactor metagenome TaxID=1076179 RepID=A0A644YXC6_9ZZZZ
MTAELPDKDRTPASAKVLNSWLRDAQKQTGVGEGRIGWILASTVAVASLPPQQPGLKGRLANGDGPAGRVTRPPTPLSVSPAHPSVRVAAQLPRPESEDAPDISGASSDFGRGKPWERREGGEG